RRRSKYLIVLPLTSTSLSPFRRGNLDPWSKYLLVSPLPSMNPSPFHRRNLDHWSRYLTALPLHLMNPSPFRRRNLDHWSRYLTALPLHSMNPSPFHRRSPEPRGCPQWRSRKKNPRLRTHLWRWSRKGNRGSKIHPQWLQWLQ